MTAMTVESILQREAGAEPVSTVVTRHPQHNTDTRVAEILGLLDSPAIADDGVTIPLLEDLERERRRLQHALTMLRTARQKLHEQFLVNKDEQQRVLANLQREWAARRRQMETQLATAAMSKAREELAEERAHLEAEYQQRHLDWQLEKDTHEREWHDLQADTQRERQTEQERTKDLLRQHRDETESLRAQLAELRDRHTRTCEEHQHELQSQQDALQKQMNEIRGQLVRAELAMVKDRAELAEERRRWTDERSNAESIIQDLLNELESRTKSANAKSPPLKRAA